MSDSQKYKSSEDEIDLRQLFNAIGRFFGNIASGTIHLIVNVRRATLVNKYLFLTLAILGGCLGLALNNFSDPIYSSSLLLSSDYFNGRIIDNSIEKLNLLCQEEGKVGLANELGLSKEVAINIIGFTAIPFISEDDRVEIEVLKQKLEEMNLEESEIDKIITRIDIENKHAFQISVNVSKSEIIEGIETALVNYFRDNSYIKNRIVSRENYLRERLVKLEKENLKLDSLKTAMIKVYESIAKKNPQGSDNLYIGDQYSSNPMTVFTEDLKINNEILNVKLQLYLQKDFEVIDGLTVYRKPISAGPKKSVAYGILIGIGIAYLLILLISINRYLSKVESEMTI
jgi:hypothetical protein